MTLPRLRQLVVAAHRPHPVAEALEQHLGIDRPFRDEGVGHFGLENAVYAVGDTFVEVVAPVRDGTAAGRQLQRRGGDCGYMAMFEVADEAATRARLESLGVRIVWESTHDDIVDLHLHPKDVPAAIVAVDVTRPVGSWRWGGPAWTAAVPAHEPGGLTGLVVAAGDPAAAATRWGAVLGVPAGDDHVLVLADGTQQVTFVPARDPATQGIVGASMTRPGRSGAADVAGVALSWTPTEGEP